MDCVPVSQFGLWQCLPESGALVGQMLIVRPGGPQADPEQEQWHQHTERS